MEQKLIVIEGIDGSGKHTQTQMLCKRLQELDIPLKQLSFPCYDSDASALVRMYLGGQFGDKPDSVNAFAASTFFAVDRFASYASDWRNFYMSGGLVITDRYTTSNAVYQSEKLESSQRLEYLRWLYDLEYTKMGIPKPDLVFYLDVPPKLSTAMRHEREKITNTHADIHESDLQYLCQCREVGLNVAKWDDWHIIHCEKDTSHMRSVESINDELFEKVCSFLQLPTLD